MTRFILCACLLGLSSCTSLTERLSPTQDGIPEPPAQFRHTEDLPVTAPKTENWWKVYHDPEMDRLVDRLHQHNPDLSAALARVDQSLAVLGQTSSGLWPSLSGIGSAKTQRDAVNELLFPIDTSEYDRYRLGVSASWEIDLWGRVRALVKRDRDLAMAEAERFRAAKLSLEALLVREIFAWRSSSAELAALTAAIAVREDDLKLQEARLELGSGVEVDVTRSRVQRDNARTAAEAASRSRGKLEHAIAKLTGLAPSELAPLAQHALTDPPKVPASIPAALLVQRPDLRAALHDLQAAALRIGLRKADFLPKITLTGTGGIGSLQTSSLFKPDSSFFDIGPELQVPLFSAGTRKAAVAQATAAWQEAVATYRSTLLTAISEVDDALLDTQSLAREHRIQRDAVNAAEATSSIARLRHERGLASYFEVVDAERERLTARRSEIALLGERHAATIRLIQALGGRW